MEAQQEAASTVDAARVGPDIGALYLQHRDAMYRVAYSMLRTDAHHRAEDVISEAMVSIVKNPPRNEVRNWEAFLVRVVQNKVRDLLKLAAQRHEQLVIEDALPLEEERHGGDQVEYDPAHDVVDRIDSQQRAQIVREAMEELEARDAQAAHVLWQCTALERTSQDVADELGVSSSRVRQIALKAREELTNILTAKEVEL